MTGDWLFNRKSARAAGRREDRRNGARKEFSFGRAQPSEYWQPNRFSSSIRNMFCSIRSACMCSRVCLHSRFCASRVFVCLRRAHESRESRFISFALIRYKHAFSRMLSYLCHGLNKMRDEYLVQMSIYFISAIRYTSHEKLLRFGFDRTRRAKLWARWVRWESRRRQIGRPRSVRNEPLDAGLARMRPRFQQSARNEASRPPSLSFASDKFRICLVCICYL